MVTKKKKTTKKKIEPTKGDIHFNEFLVVVGYNRQHHKDDKDRNILFGRISADMAMAPPNPPLTDTEMQSVAFAAKMAMAKVMLARKKKTNLGGY